MWGELASIAVLGFEDDGSLVGMTLVMPKSLLAGAVTLVIGEDPVAGGVWGIPPGGTGPDFFLPFSEGTLSLSQTGTGPGAAIVGNFSGDFSGTVTTEKVTVIVTVEPDDSRLILNEVAAKGDPLDWFELYNIGDSVIDLTGYVVADDLANAAKRVAFPPGAAIAPGEYLQVELDKDGWPGFALASDEELGIWTAGGELVATIDWEEGYSGAGESIARMPDITGSFQTVSNPTPGAANRP